MLKIFNKIIPGMFCCAFTKIFLNISRTRYQIVKGLVKGDEDSIHESIIVHRSQNRRTHITHLFESARKM